MRGALVELIAKQWRDIAQPIVRSVLVYIYIYGDEV